MLGILPGLPDYPNKVLATQFVHVDGGCLSNPYRHVPSARE